MAGTSETRRDPHPDRSEWPWWLMAADDEMSLDTLEKKFWGTRWSSQKWWSRVCDNF